MVNAMWICVAAYLAAQCYTAIAWRGGWRRAALVPLVGMVPVVVLTIQGCHEQSNLWPILLLFSGPPALLYLVVLMIVRLARDKSHHE